MVVMMMIHQGVEEGAGEEHQPGYIIIHMHIILWNTKTTSVLCNII